MNVCSCCSLDSDRGVQWRQVRASLCPCPRLCFLFVALVMLTSISSFAYCCVVFCFFCSRKANSTYPGAMIVVQNVLIFARSARSPGFAFLLLNSLSAFFCFSFECLLL